MNWFILWWAFTVGGQGFFASILLFRHPFLRLHCLLVITTASVMVGLVIYPALLPSAVWHGFLDPDLAFALALGISPLHLGFILMLIGNVIEEEKHLT